MEEERRNKEEKRKRKSMMSSVAGPDEYEGLDDRLQILKIPKNVTSLTMTMKLKSQSTTRNSQLRRLVKV